MPGVWGDLLFGQKGSFFKELFHEIIEQAHGDDVLVSAGKGVGVW